MQHETGKWPTLTLTKAVLFFDQPCAAESGGSRDELVYTAEQLPIESVSVMAPEQCRCPDKVANEAGGRVGTEQGRMQVIIGSDVFTNFLPTHLGGETKQVGTREPGVTQEALAWCQCGSWSRL